jgi:aminodeoxychorismate lyase
VTVFLNGQFVPEEQALVSAFDRGFLYGDGLFETMRVFNGRVFRWDQHLARLQRGLEFLRLAFSVRPTELRKTADRLICMNQLPNSLLRLTISRGVGKRGYSPVGADTPTIVMSAHPAPEPPAQNGWNVITSTIRLPAGQSLAAFKTCSKLPQVLARMEADAAGADEALLLNTDGFLVEGASSNLFWVQGNQLLTPPLPVGILAGVTRAVLLEICDEQRIPTQESALSPEEFMNSQGALVSLSSYGLVPICSLDGKRLPVSPIIMQLARVYQDFLRRETA